MSQAQIRWIYAGLILTLIIGIAIIPLEPVSGISFTLFCLLLIGASYIRATPRQRSLTITPRRSTSVAKEATSNKRELVRKPELVQIQVLDKESKGPQPSHIASQEALSNTTTTSARTEEKLRQRIVKLEKRVQSLQQQLTEEPFGEMGMATPGEEPIEAIPSEPPSVDLELSELAIKRILEALDEKLAKGAITKPLYDRLRDKYIARREKAKKRHKALSTRGTKESLTGE